MIEKLDLFEYQKEYLLGRFVDIMYDDFDITAIKNKLAFHFFRFTALVAGILVPIVTNLNDNIILSFNKTLVLTILGLLSSISFGFLQIFQNEKVWLHHREIFEVIRTEGYMFLNLAGEYSNKTHKESYPEFVCKVEDLIKSDIRKYIQIIDKREKNIK
ncbi:MAG TPA: DUF4231 domain-containing protein [Bacteroidales bacterium]|nr:DUF4231 domain-containing protein [Bacteroidales bacterium]HQB21117.1 DUF4231 domain-containing protein [Bacteroidales bacterium]